MSMFRRFLIGGILAVCACAAQAEVVEQDERGFVTRAGAQVTASPMETWVALISPGKWWNGAHSWSGDAANMTLTPQADGCFCERIPEDGDRISFAGSVRHMTVVSAMPEQVLRMRGGLGPLQSEPVEGVLTVTLKPVDGGTRILWEYVVGGYMRYDVATISKAVDGVMNEQLSRLAQHLGPVGIVEAETETSDEAEEDRVEEVTPAPSVEEAFEDLQ